MSRLTCVISKLEKGSRDTLRAVLRGMLTTAINCGISVYGRAIFDEYLRKAHCLDRRHTAYFEHAKMLYPRHKYPGIVNINILFSYSRIQT